MQTIRFLVGKLTRGYIWKRIALERLTEPLHLNIIALFIAVFGSFRAKVAFDLVFRQHNAYGILKAAELCKSYGIKKMAVCEFGVGTGTGLINMALIAEKVARITGVEIKVFGLDSGRGLPIPPADYRDHPEHYTAGDHAMDVNALTRRLPANAELVLGEIADTAQGFVQKLADGGYTLGYAVIDVDYYTSTRDALVTFTGPANLYLPQVLLYLDDISDMSHHPWAGELLAVDEFNRDYKLRKIVADPFFENRRIFKRAIWIRKMRWLHVLDHEVRSTNKQKPVHLANPYL